LRKFEKDYLSKIGLIKEIEPRYRSTYFLHIINGYDAGYYCCILGSILDMMFLKRLKRRVFLIKTLLDFS